MDAYSVSQNVIQEGVDHCPRFSQHFSHELRQFEAFDEFIFFEELHAFRDIKFFSFCQPAVQKLNLLHIRESWLNGVVPNNPVVIARFVNITEMFDKFVEGHKCILIGKVDWWFPKHI